MQFREGFERSLAGLREGTKALAGSEVEIGAQVSAGIQSQVEKKLSGEDERVVL